MEIAIASNYMSDTIPATDTQTSASALYSSAREKRSCCELAEPMPCSSGETSLTTADKRESTAPCSEMKESIKVRNSYGKRIRLLIASGLIAGIIPTSERRRSSQQTLDFAFSWLDGDDAEELKADY